MPPRLYLVLALLLSLTALACAGSAPPTTTPPPTLTAAAVHATAAPAP